MLLFIVLTGLLTLGGVPEALTDLTAFVVRRIRRARLRRRNLAVAERILAVYGNESGANRR